MPREYVIGQHKLWWDDEVGCARMKFVGEISPDEAREILDVSAALQSETDTSHMIIDVSESPGGVSKETKKVFSEKRGGVGVQKYAMVDTSSMTRMVVKEIMRILGQSDKTRFFKTDKEAVAWVKEDGRR